MRLHTIDTGRGADASDADGDRTVVLLHGMMGSSESWGRVIPALAAVGFRVLALDLPGHGLSPRDPHRTIERAAAAVVETVRDRIPGPPSAVLAHSYGASVLAQAADALQPALAVYIDAGLTLPGHADRAALAAQYEHDRRTRLSPEALRRSRPFYSRKDAEVEARAAARFDPATMASVSCGPDHRWTPDAGSIVVRADPSIWVSDDDVRRYEGAGVQVRSIRGAAHTVWYSHFDQFTASLPELFSPGAPERLPV